MGSVTEGSWRDNAYSWLGEGVEGMGVAPGLTSTWHLLYNAV
jgi:hypothetical protein